VLGTASPEKVLGGTVKHQFQRSAQSDCTVQANRQRSGYYEAAVQKQDGEHNAK